MNSKWGGRTKAELREAFAALTGTPRAEVFKLPTLCQSCNAVLRTPIERIVSVVFAAPERFSLDAPIGSAFAPVMRLEYFCVRCAAEHGCDDDEIATQQADPWMSE